MKFNDLSVHLDFEKIASSILGEGGYNEGEFIDAKKLVWTFAENFAARDMEVFEIEGVEKEISIEGLPQQTQPIRGYIDLHGKIVGGPKPFKDYVGQSFILDWKTSGGGLDTNWKDRLVDSWQWRIYAYHTNATLAIYRGGNREEETREVIIEVPPTNREEVEEYLAGAFAMRKSLVDLKVGVWPRRMSYSACNAYGRECPFFDQCRDYTMPRQALEDRRMSYTQLENFFLCPERSRRMLLVDDDGPGSESAEFGKCVHRGLESLYGQMMRLQKG